VAFLTILTDVSQMKKREERLCRQNRQLCAFRDVASAICSPMGMKEVLQHSIRAIVRAVSADAGCIFLANGKGARFSPLVREGNAEPIMCELCSSSPMGGFTSYVIRTGKGVLIRDARRVRRKNWVSPETLREGFRSFMSVPLMEKKGILVFGTLEVASRRANRFGHGDLRFLRSASAQVTGAIENAILREELRQALSKKARLVKDTRHRLTNNLQAIASWLSTAVQSDQWAANGRAAVDSAIRRISGMASIQQQMEVTEWETVDLAEVIARLEACVRAMHADQHEIEFTARGAPLKLNSSLASPLAIAVNELIWNSCVHGFRPDQRGLIRVKAVVNNGVATIEVRDNGIGIPEDFDLEQNADIGLCIVKNIVERDLGGHLTVRRENGTVATIRWPVTS
jgi:two-component sensor histidine kinase